MQDCFIGMPANHSGTVSREEHKRYFSNITSFSHTSVQLGKT